MGSKAIKHQEGTLVPILRRAQDMVARAISIGNQAGAMQFDSQGARRSPFVYGLPRNDELSSLALFRRAYMGSDTELHQTGFMVSNMQ